MSRRARPIEPEIVESISSPRMQEIREEADMDFAANFARPVFVEDGLSGFFTDFVRGLVVVVAVPFLLAVAVALLALLAVVVIAVFKAVF